MTIRVAKDHDTKSPLYETLCGWIMFAESVLPLEKLALLRDALAVQDALAADEQDHKQLLSSWDVYGWLWTIQASTPLTHRESCYLESMMRDVPRESPTAYWLDAHLARIKRIRQDTIADLALVLHVIAQKKINEYCVSPVP